MAKRFSSTVIATINPKPSAYKLGEMAPAKARPMAALVKKPAIMVERACGILMELASVDHKTAARALRDSRNDVKVALVMLRRGLDRAAAEKLLRRHGDHLREID